MKKRIFSLILTFVMVLSLFPAVHAGERAAQPGSIEEQIRAYAKTLDQNDPINSAAGTLAMHGITGGGKKLTLDESSALTAVLMNSELMICVLRDTFEKGVEYMQTLTPEVWPNLAGGAAWEGVNAK